MSDPSIRPEAPPERPAPFPDLQDLSFLRAIARRLLGCDHLASDAVQEALLALWLEPDRPREPRGWLVRAVVNRSRHLRRTLRRRRHHEHVASEHCRLHADCDNPLHVAMAHEFGELRSRRLASLPPEQRRALSLHEDDGLDYASIAAVTEVPIGTVRSRIARARDSLRAALAPPLAAAPPPQRSRSGGTTPRSG